MAGVPAGLTAALPPSGGLNTPCHNAGDRAMRVHRMLTLNVRFWDLLTDMNNRPMKEYGKTSAEHFRMRSFGAGFAQYSASRICTLFHSHSFLKIQPIALRFSL